MKFKWTHYPQKCNLCCECVDTCEKALRISNLKRIVRDPQKCTECQTCSTLCDNIQTEIIKEE